MKEQENGYHISFFKPTTERARFNRGIVVWLTTIWFVAIFGFHIALRVLEKPTPEPPLIAFENVWENIKNGTFGDNDLQVFTRSTLSVLGKIAINEDERLLLSGSMSWSAFRLLPDSVRSEFETGVSEFETLKASGIAFNDPSYIEAKNRLSMKFTPLIGLSVQDPLTRILPLELTVQGIGSLTDEAADRLPSIMQKYLIHNQSVLTDTVFLGFPFHYFYTSVFLLILFIGLCWLYCVRADRRNKILGIVD
jgi:uncharacterized membrane protein